MSHYTDLITYLSQHPTLAIFAIRHASSEARGWSAELRGWIAILLTLLNRRR